MTKDGKLWKKHLICRLVGLTLLLTACGGADGGEEDVYRQYGINCLANGKYPEAVEAFQSALERANGRVGEKEIDICFYKAEAQWLSGDADAAMDTYNSVIVYNDDARAYYLRGKLLFSLGEKEKGLADFAAAVERDADNYEFYIGIYGVMSAHGLEADGRQYLSRALEIRGEKASDCFYRGKISHLLKDEDGAIENFLKALDGGEVKAAFYLGQIYDAGKDTANAEKYIGLYLDSGIATSQELYELGNEEMSDGDYRQALLYYNAGLAMQTVPNRQNLMKSAITAYEYSGDFASARSLAEEYLKLYPSDEEMARESIFLQTR